MIGSWNVAAERLLFAIGQVSLTTALVIVPLLALRKLLHRRYPARVLCIVWAVLLVRLLVPVQFSLPRAPVQIEPRLTQVRYEAPADPAEGGSEPVVVRRDWVGTADIPQMENASGATYYGVLLFLLWAGVALWRLDRQFGAYLWYARCLRRTARPADSPALLAAYRAELERLGIRRELPLLYSPLADGPMLAGVLRPALLLPSQGLSAEAAPMVLRHELTHYKRHDLWLKLAAAVAQCIHWFNPAAYLLARALYEDIELACDSRVVEGMDEEGRRRYGRAILDCAASQCAARQMLTTCFTSDRETLRTRLGELFATGTKKRGIALLLACAMTLGLVGGAVTIGRGSAPDASAEAGLSAETLTEDIAAYLAARWGTALMERDYELAMPYLTGTMQQETFRNAAERNGKTLPYRFDPDAPHYGVPEEANDGFWRFGVSSPYVNAYTVLPDVAGQSATLILNWHTSAGVDTRSRQELTFAREAGEWKVSGVRTFDTEIDSAEKFAMYFGNDLGLPDFLSLLTAVEDGLYDLSDPVTAVASCFPQITGGAGAVTGKALVGGGHRLGNLVICTFPDYSAIDFVLSDQYGEGYIPVDWRIEGKNTRTMIDLASQWAYGVIHKDTHVMFPLLTENAENDLIAVQQAYYDEPDAWSWKHGKYGSSPRVEEFGVFADVGEGALRVTYALGSSGEPLYRESEILRFAETPAGLKIDSVRDLTNDRALLGQGDGVKNYEQIERDGLEWFAMQYLETPLAGNLSAVPAADAFDRTRQSGQMNDPLAMAKALLHMDGDGAAADASLLWQGRDTALVRFDLRDGSGAFFAELAYDEGLACWTIAELSRSEPAMGIRSAEAFRAAYGGAAGSDWRGSDAVPAGDVETALTETLGLKDFRVRQSDHMVFGKRLGADCAVTFADGSTADIVLAEDWDGNYYPVDWRIDGGNDRSIQELAAQWATGVCEKETRLLFPILTENGAQVLLEAQQSYSGEDWGWKHGKYGSSPTATGFLLNTLDDYTVEVIYNEVGGGYFNHHSVERLHFIREGRETGTLRLDRWEEVERGGEWTDAQWYSAYYMRVARQYLGILEPYPAADGLAADAGEMARLLTGLNAGNGWEAAVERVEEGVEFGDGLPDPGYRVTLRFADGSGSVEASLAVTAEADGTATWRLRSVNVFAET